MRMQEEILKEMLENVPDKYDKREGSVIYTALAPASVELEKQNLTAETILNLAFAETSRGDFLEMRTSEMGITRSPAVKAVRKACFYTYNNVLLDAEIGCRFSAEDINYTVIDKISSGTYKIECDTAGEIGNIPQDKLLPIDFIPDLAKAEIMDIIVAGVDEESDEKLLERYYLKVREPVTSGNMYHYRKWALEITGVGAVKVFPLWQGNGTVKVVITDDDRQPAVQDTIQKVYGHIEENRPIGATVTVTSAVPRVIDISADILPQSGFIVDEIKADIIEAVQEYFKKIAFKTDFLSYAQIGLIILSVSGVLDYSDLLINNAQGNIQLAAEEVPVLGGVTVAVK